MKILVFNTESLTITNKEKADRPDGITSTESESDDLTYKNIAAVFVCVENNDNSDDLDYIVKEIVRYHEMVKKNILLIPFFHLSSNASTDHNFNKKCLNYLHNKLKCLEILSGMLGYGYHRTIFAQWLTFGHQGSVAFRDSKFNNKL